MLDVIAGSDPGHLALADITVQHVAEFLDGHPGPASNRYRAVLLLVWKHAIAKGLTDANPVAATLPKSEPKTRQRLDLDGFLAIRDAAATWLQSAMDLAVVTCQREADLVALRFDDITERGLRVVQHKTGKGLLLDLAIRPGIAVPSLGGAVAKCRDDVASPLLIHRRPERRRREYLAGKAHLTAVTPAYLSKAFAQARDTLPRFAALPPAARPSFHELRSLGADLYRKSGWDERRIQALLGHASERMTAIYLEGHQHFTEVRA
jgi:integrase